MEEKYKVGALIAISIAWLFYLYSYVARIEPSVLVNELMTDFKITSSTVGSLIAMMYLPYVLLQVPCGIITDRFGVKKIIATSSIICALGTAIFATSTSIVSLGVGRILIGIAASSGFICCGKIAGDYFAERHHSLLMGLSTGIGCFGGVMGTTPTACLVSCIGWRNTTLVIASFGLILGVLAVLLLKDPRPRSQDKNAARKLWQGLKVLMLNPKAWILGVYGALAYLVVSAVAELWGVPFIETRYGISTELASLSSTVTLIGYGLGAIVAAFIAEKIKSYKKTIMLFSIGTVISFTLMIGMSSVSFPICLGLMALCGFFSGAETLSFTLAYHLVPREYSATSTGFLNMLVMTGGVVFQPFLGRLLDFFRNGMVTKTGEPLYTLEMYQEVFYVVILFLSIGFVLTFFIPDIGVKSK